MPHVRVKGVQNTMQFPDEMPLDDIRTFLSNRFSDLKRFGEPALAIGSGIIAEPIAGIAGITQALNPFAEEGAGAQAVEDVQEALTFQPRTQEGQEGLQAVGDSVVGQFGEIISGAEETIGDAALELTGSPLIAAGATTVPSAVLEALGLRQFSKAGRLAAKANMGILRSGVGPIPSIKTTLQSGSEGAARFREIKQFDPSATAARLEDGSVVVTHQNVKKTISDKFSHLGADTVVERFSDLESGGYMEILKTPGKQREASVLGLFVPEDARGKGAAKRLLSRVMDENPSLSGQVSSKAAATNAFKAGRRPLNKPDATLEDIFKEIDDRSSINLVTPE
jgi:hypothetical protein